MTRKSKKFVSILLLLAMLGSMIPAATFATNALDVAFHYELDTSGGIDPSAEYLIVNTTADGQAYALAPASNASGGNVKTTSATPVTISGGQIAGTSATEAAEWKFMETAATQNGTPYLFMVYNPATTAFLWNPDYEEQVTTIGTAIDPVQDDYDGSTIAVLNLPADSALTTENLVTEVNGTPRFEGQWLKLTMPGTADGQVNFNFARSSLDTNVWRYFGYVDYACNAPQNNQRKVGLFTSTSAHVGPSGDYWFNTNAAGLNAWSAVTRDIPEGLQSNGKQQSYWLDTATVGVQRVDPYNEGGDANKVAYIDSALFGKTVLGIQTITMYRQEFAALRGGGQMPSVEYPFCQTSITPNGNGWNIKFYSNANVDRLNNYANCLVPPTSNGASASKSATNTASYLFKKVVDGIDYTWTLVNDLEDGGEYILFSRSDNGTGYFYGYNTTAGEKSFNDRVIENGTLQSDVSAMGYRWTAVKAGVDDNGRPVYWLANNHSSGDYRYFLVDNGTTAYNVKRTNATDKGTEYGSNYLWRYDSSSKQLYATHPDKSCNIGSGVSYGYTNNTNSNCNFARNNSSAKIYLLKKTYHTHTPTNGVHTAATCGEGGYWTYLCSTCGQTYKEYVNNEPALGHTLGAWTYLNDTQHYRQCTRANCDQSDGYIEYGSHSWYLVSSDSNTHAHTHACSVCGNSATINDYTTLTHEHHTSTGCTPGYELYHCDVPGCGFTYQVSDGGAVNHLYDGGIITTQPDCTHSGIVTFKCTRCDDPNATFTRDIPAHGHYYDSNGNCIICGHSHDDNMIVTSGTTFSYVDLPEAGNYYVIANTNIQGDGYLATPMSDAAGMSLENEWLYSVPTTIHNSGSKAYVTDIGKQERWYCEYATKTGGSVVNGTIDAGIPENYVPVNGLTNVFAVVNDKGQVEGYKSGTKNGSTWTFTDYNYNGNFATDVKYTFTFNNKTYKYTRNGTAYTFTEVDTQNLVFHNEYTDEYLWGEHRTDDNEYNDEEWIHANIGSSSSENAYTAFNVNNIKKAVGTSGGQAVNEGVGTQIKTNDSALGDANDYYLGFKDVVSTKGFTLPGQKCLYMYNEDYSNSYEGDDESHSYAPVGGYTDENGTKYFSGGEDGLTEAIQYEISGNCTIDFDYMFTQKTSSLAVMRPGSNMTMQPTSVRIHLVGDWVFVVQPRDWSTRYNAAGEFLLQHSVAYAHIENFTYNTWHHFRLISTHTSADTTNEGPGNSAIIEIDGVQLINVDNWSFYGPDAPGYRNSTFTSAYKLFTFQGWAWHNKDTLGAEIGNDFFVSEFGSIYASPDQIAAGVEYIDNIYAYSRDTGFLYYDTFDKYTDENGNELNNGNIFYNNATAILDYEIVAPTAIDENAVIAQNVFISDTHNTNRLYFYKQVDVEIKPVAYAIDYADININEDMFIGKCDFGGTSVDFLGITNTLPAGVEAGAFIKDEYNDAQTTLTFADGNITITATKTGARKLAFVTKAMDFAVTLYAKYSMPGDFYTYQKIELVPATTLYFEDTHPNFITKTGTWSDDGTVANVKAILDNVYGGSSSLNVAATLTNSGGHSWKTTITSAMETMPTVSFTFTGTGFDIISRASDNTGIVLVKVTPAGSQDYNGYFVNTNTSYTFAGTEWVAQASGETVYQVPILHVDGLGYGTYTVEVTPYFDRQFKVGKTPADTETYFWFDAVRVYNPAASTNTLANTVYDADAESAAKAKVYDIGEQLMTGAAAYYVGYRNGTLVAENYNQYGPNNEVYLKGANNFVSFGFRDYIDGAYRVFIGASCATAGAVLNVNNHTIAINSGTDMYYDITEYVAADGKISISNAGANGSVLALTTVKVTSPVGFTSDFNFSGPFVQADEALRTRTLDIIKSTITAGDLNGDGKFTVKDNAIIKSFVSGGASLDFFEGLAADINGDGKINTRDLKLIKLMITGAI